jgi:hypothetical protein
MSCATKHIIKERSIIMTALLDTLQTRLKQYAAYTQTKAEIENMPLDVAIDLDIYKPDAAKIAAQAVYGR